MTADVHDPDTGIFFRDTNVPAGDGGTLPAWTGAMPCSAGGVPHRYGPWTPPPREPTSRQQEWL